MADKSDSRKKDFHKHARITHAFMLMEKEENKIGRFYRCQFSYGKTILMIWTNLTRPLDHSFES